VGTRILRFPERGTGERTINDLSDVAWARAVELIEAADEVCLACHVSPDGDALGSMLACALAMRARKACVASFGDLGGPLTTIDRLRDALAPVAAQAPRVPMTPEVARRA
jgi:phosphoesterase RecJ-like protein